MSVFAEALPMPLDHGCGLNQHHRLQAAWPVIGRNQDLGEPTALYQGDH